MDTYLQKFTQKDFQNFVDSEPLKRLQADWEKWRGVDFAKASWSIQDFFTPMADRALQWWLYERVDGWVRQKVVSGWLQCIYLDTPSGVEKRYIPGGSTPKPTYDRLGNLQW